MFEVPFQTCLIEIACRMLAKSGEKLKSRFRRYFVLLCLSSELFAVSTDYMVSTGFGLAVGAMDSTQFLVSPHLEYIKTPRLYLGPLVQIGISDSLLFGASASVRYMVGNHAKIRPSFEGGIGLAFTTSPVADPNIGLLIHVGMGMDYQIDPNFAVGTLFRINMAPPLDSFFLSWPVIIARFGL